MKQPRAAVVGAISLMLFSCLASSALAGVKGKAYGAPLTGTDTIKISELLADPDPHLGTLVRVEGLITGVCEKRGCWISLASDDEEFQEIRVKVTDGVIVFPIEAKGKRAIAEGVFTKVEMSLEQTLKYREHHAQEHGEEFDPSTVTEPLVYYQIQGQGAVIQ